MTHLTDNINAPVISREPEKSDADIMAETREYIEEHGWTTGMLLDGVGRVCGMGGVLGSQGWFNVEQNDVAPERQQVTERILYKVLTAAYGEHPRRTFRVSMFTDWNDNFVKDKQEVLDAFAKAEKIERAGYDPDAP